MILESTKKLEKIIEERLNAARAQRHELMVKSTEVKTGILEAEDRMNKATEAVDAEEYAIAKTARNDYEVELEMIEKRINVIDSGPLIEEEEYKALTAEILNEYKAEENDAKKMFIKAIDHLIEIAAEMVEARDTANRALYKMQIDLYRDKDLCTRIGSLPLPDSSRWNNIKHPVLFDNWAEDIGNLNIYGEEKGYPHMFNRISFGKLKELARKDK